MPRGTLAGMTQPARPTLPVPRTEAGRVGLAAVLADPGKALLTFDFDGTLSPIVANPVDARPAAGALSALRRLSAVVGQLAVITGRPAATVVELGDLATVPGVLVEGQYGAERWQEGRLELADPPPGLAEVRAALPATLSGADPGVWVEDKRLALVVHTRRAADPDGSLTAITEPVRQLAAAHGLPVHPGRYVLEIRPAGFDKGGALRRLVAEQRPNAVVFGGDDVGDLPAFDAVAALRADGTPGLTVASASAETTAVADRADVVLDGPDGVVAWLEALADAITARPTG